MTGRICCYRRLASAVFLSLSMLLVSGQAISNEEFDFDAQPVYTVKTIPNFANVCQQYVEKKLGLVWNFQGFHHFFESNPHEQRINMRSFSTERFDVRGRMGSTF